MKKNHLFSESNQNCSVNGNTKVARMTLKISEMMSKRKSPEPTNHPTSSLRSILPSKLLNLKFLSHTLLVDIKFWNSERHNVQSLRDLSTPSCSTVEIAVKNRKLVSLSNRPSSLSTSWQDRTHSVCSSRLSRTEAQERTPKESVKVVLLKDNPSMSPQWEECAKPCTWCAWVSESNLWENARVLPNVWLMRLSYALRTPQIVILLVKRLKLKRTLKLTDDCYSWIWSMYYLI